MNIFELFVFLLLTALLVVGARLVGHALGLAPVIFVFPLAILIGLAASMFRKAQLRVVLPICCFLAAAALLYLGASYAMGHRR